MVSSPIKRSKQQSRKKTTSSKFALDVSCSSFLAAFPTEGIARQQTAFHERMFPETLGAPPEFPSMDKEALLANLKMRRKFIAPSPRLACDFFALTAVSNPVTRASMKVRMPQFGVGFAFQPIAKLPMPHAAFLSAIPDTHPISLALPSPVRLSKALKIKNPSTGEEVVPIKMPGTVGPPMVTDNQRGPVRKPLPVGPVGGVDVIGVPVIRLLEQLSRENYKESVEQLLELGAVSTEDKMQFTVNIIVQHVQNTGAAKAELWVDLCCDIYRAMCRAYGKGGYTSRYRQYLLRLCAVGVDSVAKDNKFAVNRFSASEVDRAFLKYSGLTKFVSHLGNYGFHTPRYRKMFGAWRTASWINADI